MTRHFAVGSSFPACFYTLTPIIIVVFFCCSFYSQLSLLPFTLVALVSLFLCITLHCFSCLGSVLPNVIIDWHLLFIHHDEPCTNVLATPNFQSTNHSCHDPLILNDTNSLLHRSGTSKPAKRRQESTRKDLSTIHVNYRIESHCWFENDTKIWHQQFCYNEAGRRNQQKKAKKWHQQYARMSWDLVSPNSLVTRYFIDINMSAYSLGPQLHVDMLIITIRKDPRELHRLEVLTYIS